MDTKLQMIEVIVGCNYPPLKQLGLSAHINRFLYFFRRGWIHPLNEEQEQSVEPPEERQR